MWLVLDHFPQYVDRLCLVAAVCGSRPTSPSCTSSWTWMTEACGPTLPAAATVSRSSRRRWRRDAHPSSRCCLCRRHDRTDCRAPWGCLPAELWVRVPCLLPRLVLSSVWEVCVCVCVFVCVGGGRGGGGGWAIYLDWSFVIVWKL